MSQRKNKSVVQDYVISRDPEVMGGTPVFAGTRVPIQALIDHLAGGYALSEFTAQCYPSVDPRQPLDLLHRIGEMIADGELRA